MGEIFRNEVEAKTKAGKEIEIFLNKGITVPINIALEAIKNVVSCSINSNIIIDGYPRDKEQLLSFNRFIKKESNLKMKALIEIKVSKENAKNRILSRKGRADDNEKVFEDRMKYYLEYREIIIEAYKKHNKFFYINGNQDFEKAVNQLTELTSKIFNYE